MVPAQAHILNDAGSNPVSATMIYITIAQLTIFIVYIIVTYRLFGIPDSISSTAYHFGEDRKYYFMLMCWALAFLNLFQGMEGWGFLTSAGLLFTGVTMEYRENLAHSKILHGVAAGIAISSALIGLGLLYDVWLPLVLFLSLSIILFNKENAIWWIEIIAFLLILTGYILKL